MCPLTTNWTWLFFLSVYIVLNEYYRLTPVTRHDLAPNYTLLTYSRTTGPPTVSSVGPLSIHFLGRVLPSDGPTLWFRHPSIPRCDPVPPSFISYVFPINLLHSGNSFTTSNHKSRSLGDTSLSWLQSGVVLMRSFWKQRKNRSEGTVGRGHPPLWHHFQPTPLC